MLKILKYLGFVYTYPISLYDQITELGNVFLISNRIVNIFLWHCPEDQVKDPSFHWDSTGITESYGHAVVSGFYRV